MIKIVKHVCIWMAISLVVQLGGLYYIDNYYLKTDTSFKIKKMATTQVAKKAVSINIPSDATNMNASYDGRFISYCESDGLKTMDTSTGEIKQVNPDTGNKILYYNWVTDRHRLIIAEEPKSGSGNIQLKAYDADKAIKDNVNNDITWASKSAAVSDIQISPATNLIYIQVKRNSLKSEIYENNVMNVVSKIPTTSNRIGNIQIIPNEDELVYEDLSANRIVSTSDSVSMNFANIQKPIILGADNDNNIYVGNEVNGEITSIVYGDTSVPTSQWKSYTIMQGVDPEDILVTSDGNVYLNDNLKGQVTNLKTNQMTSYTGTLIKMTDKKILSDENGKLSIISYK